MRKLQCGKLEPLNAKVFTNTVKGMGQLSVRLRDAEVLVLIRERTAFPRSLLEKLPKLRSFRRPPRRPHIDIEACTRLWHCGGRRRRRPQCPAELTWALIMASMRRLPQYIGNLQARRPGSRPG